MHKEKKARVFIHVAMLAYRRVKKFACDKWVRTCKHHETNNVSAFLNIYAGIKDRFTEIPRWESHRTNARARERAHLPPSPFPSRPLVSFWSTNPTRIKINTSASEASPPPRVAAAPVLTVGVFDLARRPSSSRAAGVNRRGVTRLQRVLMALALARRQRGD